MRDASKKDSFDPKTRWMLQFTKDVPKPPGEAPQGLRSYRTRIGMLYDIIRDVELRPAVLSGRIRVFEISKKVVRG